MFPAFVRKITNMINYDILSKYYRSLNFVELLVHRKISLLFKDYHNFQKCTEYGNNLRQTKICRNLLVIDIRISIPYA